MIATSANATMYYSGSRVGKVKNIQLQTSREALDTTKLNQFDRSFIAGLRDTSATATLFYDPNDLTTVSLIEKIYEDNTSTAAFELVFDSRTEKSTQASAVVTRISVSASYGSAQVCDIEFRVSGKPVSNF